MNIVYHITVTLSLTDDISNDESVQWRSVECVARTGRPLRGSIGNNTILLFSYDFEKFFGNGYFLNWLNVEVGAICSRAVSTAATPFRPPPTPHVNILYTGA